MSSKRASILSAVKTRLQGILTTGGYATNLGQKVTDWKITSWGPDDVPGVTFRDISNKREEPGIIGKFRWNLLVEIEIIAQAPASTVRSYVADVLKAIGADPKWSGLAVRTDQPDVEMSFDQFEKIIGGARISLPIIYDANMWED